MSDNKSPWGQGEPKKFGQKTGQKSGQNNGQNGKPSSPWGNNSRPDRERPNAANKSQDLENVIQGFKKRASGGGGFGGSGSGMPDNPFGKFGPLGIVVGVAVLLMVTTSIYTVDQQEEAVVLRFGQYSRTVGPGLNFKFPAPFETYQKVKTRVVKKTAIGGNDNSSLMLTGDENIVDIDFTVLWRISDLKDYVFEVADPSTALKAVAESAMREIVGKSKLEDIITTKRLDTTIAVRDLMQSTLDEYKAGIEVVEVQLQKADAPDGRVVDAFRDVVDANQEKETLINEATAYQNTVVPAARGAAAKIIQDSEGYKGQVVAEAKGEAERFNLVLGEYKAAPQVTRQRIYLETIEKVYGPADKIILDSDAGSGVVPYLPLDQLGKKKGAN